MNKLRERALRSLMEHIHYEDVNTQYVCICAVNKVILLRPHCLHLNYMHGHFVLAWSCFYYYVP
jgi:hypothetical protein